MGKRPWLVLWIIFLFALGIRLLFVFQSDTFSDDGAYFTLRQVEAIRATGLPLFEDPLSYGGRFFFFPPLFHYLLALFTLFLPITTTLKLLPNLFSLSLVFIVYFLSYEITKMRSAALFAAFVAAFTPILYTITLNDASPYSLTVPLLFFYLYCLLRVEEQTWMYASIPILLLLSLEQTTLLVLIPLFAFYFFFLKLEQQKLTKAEIEIAIFTLFFLLWIQFVAYKKAFLLHGSYVIWQNIPQALLANYFQDVAILPVIAKIGSLPFIYGMYSIYSAAFGEKPDRKTLLLLSMVFAVTFLLWFKLIQINLGLLFLGVTMTILFAQFVKTVQQYLKKGKLAFFRPYFYIFLVCVFLITSVWPSFAYARETMQYATTQEEIDALLWLRQNSYEEETVLASAREGHLITAIAERKNVLDGNFLFASDADMRYEAMKEVYTTIFKTEALRLSTKYNVSYVYLSPKTMQRSAISTLRSADDQCITLEYQKGVSIYEIHCTLAE